MTYSIQATRFLTARAATFMAVCALTLSSTPVHADDDIKFRNDSRRLARLEFREPDGDVKGTYLVRPGERRTLDDGKGHDLLRVNGVTRRVDSWGHKRKGTWYIHYGTSPRPVLPRPLPQAYPPGPPPM